MGAKTYVLWADNGEMKDMCKLMSAKCYYYKNKWKDKLISHK